MAGQTESQKGQQKNIAKIYKYTREKYIFNYFMGQVNDIPFNISYSKFKNINAF